MRNVLTGLAALLMVVVITQFFLAGGGAVESGSGDFYDLHRRLGTATGPLALLTTLVAALLRAPGRLIGLAGLATGLASLQFLLAIVGDEVGDGTTGSSLLFGLHAVNGLLMMAAAGTLVRATRRMSSPATRQPQPS